MGNNTIESVNFHPGNTQKSKKAPTHCPKCDALLDNAYSHCPICNHDLQPSQPADTVRELTYKLAECITDEQKATLIAGYYIPGDKESLCNFIILACSNLNVSSGCTDVWKLKLEQAYLKAQIVFSQSTELEFIKKMYENTIKKSKKKASVSYTAKSTLIFIIGLCMILISMQCIYNHRYIYGYHSFIYSPFSALFIAGLIPFIAGIFALLCSERNKHKDKRK